jgi:hypothetical protein
LHHLRKFRFPLSCSALLILLITYFDTERNISSVKKKLSFQRVILDSCFFNDISQKNKEKLHHLRKFRFPLSCSALLILLITHFETERKISSVKKKLSFQRVILDSCFFNDISQKRKKNCII